MTLRAIVLLSCAGAVLMGGPPARAEVVRQTPEEKVFNTRLQPRFSGFLYAPKAPGAGGGDATPVIFYSGGLGWLPLQQDAASFLASTGRYVLGIEFGAYFASEGTDDDLRVDLTKFRSFLNERAARPGTSKVILVGFASGAEIIPYLLNHVEAAGVRGAVLLAPTLKGAKVFRVSTELKFEGPPGESIDVGAELKRMPPVPVVLMQGSLDKNSAAKALSDLPRGPHLFTQIVGGDHQFHQVRDSLFSQLADALRWIDGQGSP